MMSRGQYQLSRIKMVDFYADVYPGKTQQDWDELSAAEQQNAKTAVEQYFALRGQLRIPKWWLREAGKTTFEWKDLTGEQQTAARIKHADEVAVQKKEDKKARKETERVAAVKAAEEAAALEAVAQAALEVAALLKKKEGGVRDRTIRARIALLHLYTAKLNALLLAKGGEAHFLTLTEVSDKAEPNLGGGFKSKATAKSEKRQITITTRGEGFAYFVGKLMKQATDDTPYSHDTFETAVFHSAEDVDAYYKERTRKRARRPTVNHHVGLPAIIIAGEMPTASGDVWASEDIAAYMDEEVDMGEDVDMNDV
ncbi:hypothetical protein B484DRAFT_468643 [Ochromonadaceae sp. CCMP2298]|nr:hypothetical protein B484DRAFT_468643 [Ochromonadaceae sp. CCMP2298]